MLRSQLPTRGALRSVQRKCSSLRAAAGQTERSTPESPTPGFFIDEAAMLATSTFPISPPALVAKAKHVLVANFGSSEPELLAEDFQFLGTPHTMSLKSVLCGQRVVHWRQSSPLATPRCAALCTVVRFSSGHALHDACTHSLLTFSTSPRRTSGGPSLKERLRRRLPIL